jgi:hypothetical protein
MRKGIDQKDYGKAKNGDERNNINLYVLPLEYYYKQQTHSAHKNSGLSQVLKHADQLTC